MSSTECQHYNDPVSNRLRKLIEANRSLAEIESLDDLLLRLMDLAKKVTAAEASLIFLYNSAANLNKEMYELMSDEGFFATMVLNKYWPGSGRVQTARAGHPYPLWVINRGLRELSKLDGIPIGVEFETEYEKTEFVLSPGEAVLFITDGVTEAENKESELFGDTRLTDYFKAANGPPWAEGLLERIDSWRGNAAMNDDLTIVEIWRDPPR